MKKLLLLISLLILLGCGKFDSDKAAPIVGFDIIEIDSCEYIIGYHKFAHKGNCRFCTKRRQEEIRNIIKNYNGN